jgi:hypothetical protein
LKIAAVSDLGGLGAKEGSPTVYNWTRPNPLPVLLPWLAVLFLLLLKPNRCAQAWWIWVPVGCVVAVGAASQSELGFIPSSLQDMLGGTVRAVGFGLAAVWLIAGYLGWKHRAVAWVGTLLALGGISLLSLAISQGLEGIGPEMLQGMILLAAAALVISVAITLAGLVCRGRYGALRLCLWLIAALLVVWLLVIGPFFVAAMIFSPGNVPVLALVGTVLSLAGVSFGVLLPFVILSFVSTFYRARLKDLLHLGREAAPPVIVPVTQAPRLLEVEP